MKDLKRLFGYMGPYKRDMALGMLLVVIESAFEMVIPILMSDIIDEGVANQDMHCILVTGVKMAICAVLALITGLLYARYAAPCLLRVRRPHPPGRVQQASELCFRQYRPL